MPIAIVYRAGGAIPAILSEASDELLAARIATLPNTPSAASVPAVREWLATLPEPSGWFATIGEAQAHMARLRDDGPTMSGDELRRIRESLDMGRAEFGAALGFAGNENTRHKQVFEMEAGTKPIMPERARRARALYASAQIA
jgi:hypothetical protein